MKIGTAKYIQRKKTMAEIRKSEVAKAISIQLGPSLTQAHQILRGFEDRPKIGFVAAELYNTTILLNGDLPSMSREALASMAKGAIIGAEVFLDELEIYFAKEEKEK